MPLSWNKSMSVHVQALDSQHKSFIQTLNRLIAALDSNCTADELFDIAERLREYTRVHFKTEEDLFRKTKYPDAREHILEHAKFKKAISGFTAKIKKDHIAAGFEMVDFVEDWLINHLAMMDQKYSSWLTEHGVK